ncbi:histidine phosphatase family protein [Paraliomyxa miuraensis]|uniref:histidine phosphatase family protein n=1 Tax=Paraliomyxa miuraensis TaxID=376150 RepID=UPI00225AA29D|nr:histidine phosphatase family protein [Paraliomyxa miuraensis]MCX4242410.1 histidine phosphatase family protein [Paraliomyxa miuraensis]
MSHEPPICRRVFLMRHGHYERTGNLGDTVWGLSPLGRRQAVRVGRRLAQLVDSASGRFEGVYASPWPRATQSAEIAGREMDLDNIRIKRYLHELVPLVDPERPEFKSFPIGLEATPSEGRVFVDQQIDKIRDRFFKPPTRRSFVLLFAHGNLIRYLVARTLRLPYEAWAMMDIAHASISELRVYANGFEALISFNETGHLPPSMVTTA